MKKIKKMKENNQNQINLSGKKNLSANRLIPDLKIATDQKVEFKWITGVHTFSQQQSFASLIPQNYVSIL